MSKTEKRASPWSGYSMNTDKAIVRNPRPLPIVAVIKNPLPHGYQAPGPLLPEGSLDVADTSCTSIATPETKPVDMYPEKVV
jgi:hypothetical protein